MCKSVLDKKSIWKQMCKSVLDKIIWKQMCKSVLDNKAVGIRCVNRYFIKKYLETDV